MNIKIKPGDRFGKLVVLERAANHITSGGNSLVCWKCRCDCGNVVTPTGTNLKKMTSCGMCRGEDITGKRFGRLVVLGISEEKNGNRRLWKCRCDCGNIINVSIDKLNSGKTISCGCRTKEIRKNFGNMVRSTTISADHREKQTVISIIREQNGKNQKNNASGKTGVSWSKSNGKYFSYIGFRGKRYNLGYYHELKDAIRAREIAEDELHKNFVEWYAKKYPEQYEKIKSKHGR